MQTALEKQQHVTKNHSFQLVRLQSQATQLLNARHFDGLFQQSVLQELKDCHETIAYLKGRVARLTVEFYSSKTRQFTNDDLDDTPRVANRHRDVYKSWNGCGSPRKGGFLELASMDTPFENASQEYLSTTEPSRMHTPLEKDGTTRELAGIAEKVVSTAVLRRGSIC